MATVQNLTGIFACPSCRGALRADDQGLSCPRCSTRGRHFAENLVDFLGGDEAHARTILGWRDNLVPDIEKGVTEPWRQNTVEPRLALPAEQAAFLHGLGLLGSDGKFTPLGRMAGYNSLEFLWQSNYDPLEGLVAAPELTPETRLLDLGGGSGQTLRRLFSKPEGTVVCLDADLDILAFGAKLFSAYGMNALFCRGSAHHLPLRDGYFDYIICRGVISYTHQKRALTEAFRVLRPGGWIFLRLESINWDLRALTHPTSPLRFLFDVRSLAWGLLHAVTGYQPMPGGKIKGPRAFVPRRRFRKIVAGLGGQVVRYESSGRGPQHRGRGTQDVALCIRRPAPAAAAAP
jgi:SAM-dependent methyltransferase